MRFSWRYEEGFALIAAMMAILILTGVGMLVFMISTQDIRISGRLVGEKKAVSAAEAGAHSLSTTFNPFNLASNAVANVPVDSTNDPGSQYSIGIPSPPCQRHGSAAHDRIFPERRPAMGAGEI